MLRSIVCFFLRADGPGKRESEMYTITLQAEPSKLVLSFLVYTASIGTQLARSGTPLRAVRLPS